MAWHKQKQYDPTDAFIQNERHQKLLDLQLEKIDKLWYNQLRIMSRGRLETTSELIRLEDEKNQLEYFDENMDVHQMKDYIDSCLTHMKSIKRELSHDNFNFDNSGAMHLKRVINQYGKLNLPKLDDSCFVTQQARPKKAKKSNKNRLKKRRKSNLFKSKIFSMSDSNLDKISKYKQEKETEEERNIDQLSVTEEKAANPSQKSQLPMLPVKRNIKRNLEPHRYLKEQMATTLVLPTVKEVVPRQRKLSI
jgi:hypothetical protein